MFELTFLTAGPDSQTLVVALYYSVFAAGHPRAASRSTRWPSSTCSRCCLLLVIALRFVNPTQLVTQMREQPAE